MTEQTNDTLEDYFDRAMTAGVIDFHLRIVKNPAGRLDFYIHPQNGSGETADFSVGGGFVQRLGCAAGSARSMVAPLLGSRADAGTMP